MSSAVGGGACAGRLRLRTGLLVAGRYASRLGLSWPNRYCGQRSSPHAERASESHLRSTFRPRFVDVVVAVAVAWTAGGPRTFCCQRCMPLTAAGAPGR